MKKYIYSIVPLLFVFLLLQGCKKVTTEGYTQITTYPIITISGEPVLFVKQGESFTDPGYKATLDGEEVTEKLIVKSNVNTAKPGKYSVNYSISNEDGFSAQENRTVYVFDATASALSSKFYTVAPGSNRNGSPAFSGYKIAVYQVKPGEFAISDFIGGYYDQRAGYGPAYAAVGSFKLNTDNTLSLVSSFVAGWGDELDDLKDGVFNPATGEIKYTAAYAGQFNFNIILK